MLTSMKNRTNKQQSKKGVILVTILFIFCIATIFITCAIMMTSTTRERLYDKAEVSQCRLTVTSAAEAFYQALINQRIPDTELESFCNSGTPRMLTVSGSTLPGLSTSPDNCTTYVCKKGANANTIIVEFTTTIGTASDSVRLTLYKTPPTANQPAFTQMVETQGNLNAAEMAIGMGGAGRSDNTVLVRGNAEIKGGESSTGAYSNYVFLNEFTPRGGFAFQGDVVLWGTSAKLNMKDAQGGGFYANNVFFVNPTNSTRTNAVILEGNDPANVRNWGFINTDATFNSKTMSDVLNVSSRLPDNILFLSATFDSGLYATSGVSSMAVAHPVGIQAQDVASLSTWIGNHSNLTGGSSQANNLAAILQESIIDSFGEGSNTLQSGSFADRVDNYISTTLVDQIKKPYPDLSTAQSTIFGISGLSASSAVNLTASAIQSYISGTAASGHKLPLNNEGYVINGLTIKAENNNATTGYIEVDLSEPGAQTQVIFISGNVKLDQVRIFVNTDDSNDFLKIVLTSGATIWFGGDNGRGGIYSSTGREASDVNAGGGTWANTAANPKPHAYIFGMGSNTVTFFRGSMVEAYVGLYGPTGNTSTVEFADANSTNSYFLGRIMANTVKHVQGGALNIPYCVGPNEDDQQNGLVVINSQYKVYGFEYFTSTVVTPAET